MPSGPEHWNWRGGEWSVPGGYVRATISAEAAALYPTALRHGNGWSIPRSHIVWNEHHPEDMVQPGEHVHHRNHIRDDDRIENLEKRDGSRHERDHRLEKPHPRGPDGRFIG